MELQTLVAHFAKGLTRADARRPVSKRWRPGIGPHDKRDVVRLVLGELVELWPEMYAKHDWEVQYPQGSERCDLCVGEPPNYAWALEIKALRMLGDKGIVVQGRDDVSRILSPYPKQRSALTDCTKLAGAGVGDRQAVLIYAYDADDYPMAPLVDAFEVLAQRRVQLGPRCSAPFDGLIHPVHARGAVYAWELLGRRTV